MTDLSKKTDTQLNTIVTNHFDAGVTEAPLLTAAKRELAVRAVTGMSAKDRRTVEQELGLRELADGLGWPVDVKQRSAAGISDRGLRYGECHYAWVVMETFTRSNQREPSVTEREALAGKHGLNPGNIGVEHSNWLRERTKSVAP